MQLNLYGTIVNQTWKNIPLHFKNAQLDVFQIMPNHLHGIIVLTDKKNDGTDIVGAKHCKQDIHDKPVNCACNASPLHNGTRQYPTGTKSRSISSIMQNFLSVTTRKINRIRHTPGLKLWQRGFYDHIIRNENELWAIRRYINDNPTNWRM